MYLCDIYVYVFVCVYIIYLLHTQMRVSELIALSHNFLHLLSRLCHKDYLMEHSDAFTVAIVIAVEQWQSWELKFFFYLERPHSRDTLVDTNTVFTTLVDSSLGQRFYEF